MWIRILFYGLICTASLLSASMVVQAQQRTPVWSDEFDGAAGTAPDPTKWTYDLGGWGWGNNEWQTYTNRTQNSSLDGMGHLVIKAIQEPFTGSDGIFRNYTSARLVTRGIFELRYGRVEARLRVPFGQGIWPAFWMLGNDINSAGWPNCGEIDIMENIGREPSTVHGSLHGPGYSGGSPLTGSWTIPDGKRFADDFHIFAVEWEPREIRFYIDGLMYQKRGISDLPSGARWVFDHPFYLLMNVAVGGNWPGYPDATTVLPQAMTVDYVRIYSNARTSIRENRPQPRKIQ